MALGKVLYRKAFPDLRDELRRTGASLLARRCFDELTIGRHSSATGAFLLDPEYLRVDLGEHSKAKVIAALEELERLGWLSWCRQTRAAVLPQYAHRCPGGNPSHTQGLLAECLALPPSPQRDLAVEIITKVSTGSDKALATLCGESPHQKQKQNQEQKQDKTNSLPIGRHVPAAADTDRQTVGQTGQFAATQQQSPQAALLPLDDHTPAQAKKRQPQGQDGGKTPKRPRTVAEQKPTAEQTRAYFASQNAPTSEADACLDYWQAQGFKRRAGPILDWEATCRTWIRSWRERGSQTQPGRYGNGKRAPIVAPTRTPEEVAASIARENAEWERCEREGRSYF